LKILIIVVIFCIGGYGFYLDWQAAGLVCLAAFLTNMVEGK